MTFLWVAVLIVIYFCYIPSNNGYSQGFIGMKKVYLPRITIHTDHTSYLRMTYFGNFFSDPKKQKTGAERKKHQNKYDKFSKAVEDRSEEEYFEKLEQEEEKKAKANILRKTTIPMSKRDQSRTKNTALQNKTTKAHEPETRVKIRELISDLSTVDPSDPYTFGYTEIGEILIPHGVYGEMKLDVNSNYDRELIRQLNKTVYIKKPDRRTPRPITLLSCRKQSHATYLIQLEGIDSRMRANLFRRYKVYILKSDLPPLEKNEYLIRDLVGLYCYQCNNHSEIIDNRPFGTVIGIVPPEEMCENPQLARLMHSLLEIQKIGSKELCLIPFVPDIVKEVELDRGRILIDPPGGLLDLVYEEEEQKIIKGLLPAHIDWLSDEIRAQLEKNTIVVKTSGTSILTCDIRGSDH